ncbi:hypothetical protein [Streptomyces sp. cg35]|uniref:hypothetical protein n=1 Tax=Streptomyces sp. cg35 TaxID=3421650 RepID=UPI003D17CA14
MNEWLLWCGVAVFGCGVLAREVQLARHAGGPRPARLGAYTDPLALAAGVVTLVLWLSLSTAGTATAWGAGIIWALAVCNIAHMTHVAYRNAS